MSPLKSEPPAEAAPPTLPVQLNVAGRRALVVGAEGEVVTKIHALTRAGADVLVVAEGPVDDSVLALAEKGQISLERRPFATQDRADAWIIYVALGHDDVARDLFAWALRERRLLCTVDRPETCTFVSAAVVSLPSLTLTVSTHGASPGVARRLREDFEALFGDPRFERFLGALRARRGALPRGQRAGPMAALAAGFRVVARLVYPAWFDAETPNDRD